MNPTATGSLHHIELYVSDLARSLEFWEWFLGRLGYRPHQEWPGGKSLIHGDTYLVFVQAPSDSADAPFNRRQSGLNHLAFHVGTDADVDDLTAALRARGVRILYEDRHPHAGGPDSYAVFCEDPDGLKVEGVATRAPRGESEAPHALETPIPPRGDGPTSSER